MDISYFLLSRGFIVSNLKFRSRQATKAVLLAKPTCGDVGGQRKDMYDTVVTGHRLPNSSANDYIWNGRTKGKFISGATRKISPELMLS
jgi:hypothetical protein